MIPYFQIFRWGPVSVWGFFVALGILASTFVLYRIKKEEKVFDLVFWSVLGALVGGRLFGLLERPREWLADPFSFFRIWEGGMAISGGIVVGVLAGVLYARFSKMPLAEYSHLVAFVFPLGEGIGRIGCFLIYDHPGSMTRFFLGQTYLDGVIRHNLGLYLSLHGFLLFGIFVLLRKKHFTLFAPLFLVEYGVLRFFMDYFRLLDTRYGDFTIAQYSGIIFFMLGVIWFWYARRKGKAFKG